MFNDLLKEIKEANPEILNRPIDKWTAPDMRFVKESFWQDSASVNIFRVKGTQHPDYAGLTWLEFLETGKRMALNLNFFKTNPDYYRQTEKKIPSMYYQSIDGGELYIGGDGNHRTAICKAFFYLTGETTLHGVTVTDYRMDNELKNIFDDIKKTIRKKGLSVDIDIVSETASRDDSGGWMLEKYNHKLKVMDYKKNKDFLLNNNAEAKEFLEDINMSKFRRFFGFLKK